MTLRKNLVNNFHWICSMIKIYSICSVPAEYRNGISQSDSRILYQPFLQHKSMKWRNSQKLKVDQKFYGWASSKKGEANLVCGSSNWLYLKNEKVELTDFLHASKNSHILKDNWKFLVLTWEWQVWWWDCKIGCI